MLSSLHCACALHVDGFPIVLPDITLVDASEPAIRRENLGESASSWLQKPTTPKEVLSLNGIVWSFRLRKPTLTQDSVPNTSNVTRNDSAERQVALERRQERLRGRILGMKRAGLTDFEIAER